jgi:hypothetical protein
MTIATRKQRATIAAKATDQGAKYRIRADGQVDFYGTMPNTNVTGWWMFASCPDYAVQFISREDRPATTLIDAPFTAPDFAPVIDADTARAFLTALDAAALLYHPEDRADDCLSCYGLSVTDLARIEDAMRSTHLHLSDPCVFCLTLPSMADPQVPA